MKAIDQQPSERGPIVLAAEHYGRIPHGAYSCNICRATLSPGDEIYYVGSGPIVGATYRRHVTCARDVAAPRKASEGGKAGRATNGRIVRGGNSMS